MFHINTISRRNFVERALTTGAGLAGLAALTTVPPFVKRALAEGNIGLQGKKLLFIWLRGANDGLNTVIPTGDTTYDTIRPDIRILKEGATDYNLATGSCDVPVIPTGQPTYNYPNAIRMGNGFAALHPSLRFLAPMYNSGELAIVHRVGYPRQSRSHFDSQNYWENGSPNNNVSKDGILYRTILESGLANTSPLTGVTIQSALPLIMRGSQAAMTNLSDPTRYDLLGVPNSATTGDKKATNALLAAQSYQKVDRNYRELLQLHYGNLNNTLAIFAAMDWTEGTTPTPTTYIPSTTGGNHYHDDVMYDGETQPYYLFPTINQKNGGYVLNGNNTNKYVVPTGSYGYFRNLKAAAMILNNTDAFIAGTEFGGFDTHSVQVTLGSSHLGGHTNLMRQLGWSIYALSRYFKKYGRNGTAPTPGAKCSWDDVVIVTLSEFGRTSVENQDNGTDHAEAGVMFVAGGTVQGLGRAGHSSGIWGCATGGSTVNSNELARFNLGAPASSAHWLAGPRTTSINTCGTLFAASPNTTAGYLRRSSDYRSILGEIIRKHLGATQNQLNRIIPGYLNESTEHLLSGGTVTSPIEPAGITTPILGEVGLL